MLWARGKTIGQQDVAVKLLEHLMLENGVVEAAEEQLPRLGR
jgi:hypothetical protein